MKTKNNNTNYILIKNQSIFDIIEDRINADQYGSTVIIPHVCNNINLFGAGFAGAVARHYPNVKANFHMLNKNAKLGHNQYVISKTNPKYRHSIIFVNMIAQNKTIDQYNRRPLNYGALVYCMTDINQYIQNFKSKYDSSSIEIHAPKFGSGLAGGNWSFISLLIHDIWQNQEVFIYE